MEAVRANECRTTVKRIPKDVRREMIMLSVHYVCHTMTRVSCCHQAWEYDGGVRFLASFANHRFVNEGECILSFSDSHGPWERNGDVFLVEKTTRDCRVRNESSGGPFFPLHCPPTIDLRTEMRVPCHPLTATNHGHTHILLFTHLLRKTSVIGSIKVKDKVG
jgi:hypothetical protein